MAAPHALEADVKELRAEITRLASEHAAKYDEAEQFAASVKAKNPDTPVFELAEFSDIDAAYTAADVLKEKQADLTEKLAKVLSHGGREVNTDTRRTDAPVTAGSLGSRLVASTEYQTLLASGSLHSSNPVTMPNVEVASRAELNSWLAASSGTGLINRDQQLLPTVQIPRRSVRLLDMITIAQTDSDIVDWSRQSTLTQAAAGVAPGTASAESTYAWEKQTAVVKRIAHHTTVLKTQLADAARMETEINSELQNGILLRTEAQVLAGNGAGENFAGIVGTAGISTQAKGADTIPDAVHKGITAVRVALEDDINAIGVHPNDYQRYVLVKDSTGNYLSGRGPQDSTAATIWGYPAIVSTVFTEGTALAGNWMWAYLWLRSGVTLGSGYINAQLIEAMMTMTAEYRAAFAVKQPKAFCTITGLNA